MISADAKTEAAPAAAAPAPATHPASPEPRRGSGLKRGLILIGIVVILIVGVRWFWHSLHTESTDDAYVNSYVTFVAPRVAGQVQRVLVDDNNRVKKGDVLVELDPEPFHVQVSIKQAALDAAQADLKAADASTRSQIASARGQRFKLQHAIEDVDNLVATLRARAANWEQAKASASLAETEFERAKHLLQTKVVSPEEYDKKRETLDVAQAQVKQAMESVYQARAALGLPHDPGQGKSLTDVPADIDQTFSSVRQALADLIHAASVLGVVQSSYDLTPKQTLDEFYKRDPSGDIDVIYREIIKEAPAIKQAQAAVLRAQRDLDQAQLDLRYCTIVSEIDGVVTRRNVNAGNNVQIGQSLMAVRSLRDVWIDANFKETQLRKLRIGQHVDIRADMYGGKQHFEGRISGFTMGTGSTLALLPPQNATGNFVKVVQRVPVRIDLLNYDADKLPLFVGVSVEPEVDLRSTPSGPDAGHYLQEAMTTPAPAKSAAPEKP